MSLNIYENLCKAEKALLLLLKGEGHPGIIPMRKQEVMRALKSMKNAGKENSLVLLLDNLCSKNSFMYSNKLDNESIELIKPILSEIKEEKENIKKDIYFKIYVEYQGYNIKTALWKVPEVGFYKELQYLVVTTHTKQELNALLATLQKGVKRISVNGETRYQDIYSVKNAYTCLQARCPDENKGDGVHAIIYLNGKNVIRVHKGENTINKVFDWIKLNARTGVLPEWSKYLYNELKERELISLAEGVDLTGKAPEIVIMSKEITTEVVREIKQEGLRNGKISIPADEVVEFNPDATFLELVQNYVLGNIQEEDAHYNVGEPISDILKSEIKANGKTSRLYPRQQVIAQGMLNALKEGKTSQILNGGTGIGKTYISIKLIAAIMKEFYKKENGRVIVYAQGHLIPKWKRQCNEALNPLGIFPKFYEINNYKDVFDIPNKPEGYEIFLMPKDRVKRSYQVQFSAKPKFNSSSFKEIADFIVNNKESVYSEEKDLLFLNGYKLSISLYKAAAVRIARETERPVILYKPVVNEMTGEVETYKVTTTSEKLKKIYGKSNKSYDFIIKDLSDFMFEVENIKDSLIVEEERKCRFKPRVSNGLICPECGGVLYNKPKDMFDEEKYLDYLVGVPNDKSISNSKCRQYIKADGTPLMPFELKAIRNGAVGHIFTSKKVAVPYCDDEGNPLEEEKVEEIKSGKCQHGFSILVTTCGASLWSAFEQKGYRVANSADVMLRKFGKKHFDMAICDEVHLYAKESEQGITFGKICLLSKSVFGLSGTITGGKASDLYYTFWRMFPSKMAAMGYDYSDVTTFVEHYGRRKKTTKETLTDGKYNKSGKGRKYSSGYSEIPGISPLLYSNFLSGVMVSRKIEDMGIPMPPIKYFRYGLEMDADLSRGYNKLKDDLITFIKMNKELPLGGSYINSLLAYPDMPVQEPIYYKGSDMLVANPTVIDIENRLFAKEKKLLQVIKKEINEGRKVLVYSVFSGLKGVSERLLEVIRNAGIYVEELKSTVPLEKREGWIEKMDQKGVQVIITNPECVATGLDICGFPSVYFYELSYNVKTMRQAEKRAYRPGQDQECRVYYSYYEDTLQEEAIKLIGAKKKASLALEGVFAEDMLSAMGDGGDDGAKILFNVLKGKVKLAEEELDIFGFEDETETEIQDNSLDVVAAIPIDEPVRIVQTDLFALTEEMHNKLSKSERKRVDINQMSFLSF